MREERRPEPEETPAYWERVATGLAAHMMEASPTGATAKLIETVQQEAREWFEQAYPRRILSLRKDGSSP